MHTSNGSTSTEIPTAPPLQKPQPGASPSLRNCILRGEDALPAGSIGALLGREGIYSSQLYAWRKQREEGEIGPWYAALERRASELERENRKRYRTIFEATRMRRPENHRRSWATAISLAKSCTPVE